MTDAAKASGSVGASGGPAGAKGRGWRGRVASRAAIKRLGVLGVVLVMLGTYGYFTMLWMPGRSYRGALPALTEEQGLLAAELRRDVEALASGLGKRSTFHPQAMAEAARHIIGELERAGYAEHEEVFVERGSRVPNIAVEVRGGASAEEIVVIGAHYDSYQGTPGADDNASGVAATLALARRFGPLGAAEGKAGIGRTIRFVFFVNEEPPSFMTRDMGSWVYARHCRERRDQIVAMLSLETLGFYTETPGYQKYPPLVGAVFPEAGDWIGFIGDLGSRELVRRCVGAFRESARFPSEGAALPSGVPGVGWSDHWAFWQEGYPAIMVTDTATYRNPHYHIDSDTADKLDFERTARVVEGLVGVARELVR